MAAGVSVLRHPRSFLGVLVAGFVLVATPLAATLFYSVWRTEQLAEQSRGALLDAVQAARTSRALVNRIASLERLALQLTVIQELELKAGYESTRAAFRQAARELQRLSLDASQQGALAGAIEREEVLHKLLAGVPEAVPDVQAVRKAAAALADHAQEVLAISSRIAAREVARLQAAAEDAHRRSMAFLLAAIAVALATALVLARSIARPIAELDSAIRQLGSADFERPIEVSGPDDLRNLGVRLDWLRRRLIELEAQKNRFLRHLSHDLKTPLAALREGTELLHDGVAGPLAPPQRQVVAILRDNSYRLQRMIEELLHYQRALHAASALEFGIVQLDALLRQSAQAHRLAADAKAQHISVDAPPLTVCADPAKVRSIVDNLVGNAVKFTPPGGAIRLVARDRGDAATVEVLDSGPGVATEEREAIFEAFFRGHAGGHARTEGVGLGLAIAREFAEAHGGRIDVLPESRGGHFRLTLPKRGYGEVAEAA